MLAGGAPVASMAELVTADGARLHSYTAGSPGQPAIVLASACGMPARLSEQWLRFLAREHFVVTWETRGLSEPIGPAGSFDRLDHSLAAQAGDLIAVMDHHRLRSAHVMGLCGGAVVALAAAARDPERVASISLWHGDFSGSPCRTTPHQDNLKALLVMASGDRRDAAAINQALADATIPADLPHEVAELVRYPYTSDELFYRYCRLTGATMTTDVGPLLPGLRQPTLVVTSEDDQTAHPAGSHWAASRMPAAELAVEPHGDHLSVFGAGPRLQRLLVEFLAARR